MIECSDENIYYTKKKRKNNKRFKKIIIFIIIIFFIIFYSKQITSTIAFYTSKEIEAISTLKVNEVIISTDNKFKYNDIVNIEKNTNGDIILIETNSLIVNEISSEYSVRIKKELDTKLEKGILIPWTAFTGVKIFSGYGREVLFKTLEISSVSAEIKGDFFSQGINQTLHRIFLVVEVKTNILLPLNKKEISTKKNVLLTENVIVGKIPEIYLQN